jgi:hypothetical protein
MIKDGVCPKCKGQIDLRSAGAISRIDNKTEICSPCGLEEAIEAFIKSQWATK